MSFEFLAATPSAGAAGMQFVLMMVLMLALMYFMIYRPQKKQQKKETEMRNSLEIGDEVTTIGGIVGRVISIKDDTFVMETSSDRTKLRFRRSAIGAVQKLNVETTAEKK